MERKALIDRIQGVFMIRRYTVALMQMDTQNDKGKNLETACAWIDEAAAKGAKLICFPEVMNLIGKNIVHDRAPLRESEGTRRLYSRGQYHAGTSGGKTIGKYECADFAGGEDSGDIQQTAYV